MWLVATILVNAVPIYPSIHLISPLVPINWLTGQPTKDRLSFSLCPSECSCGV